MSNISPSLSFLAAIENKTTPHPIKDEAECGTRVWTAPDGGKVDITLLETDKDTLITLDIIEAEKTRCGHGSLCLQWLHDTANSHNVCVQLNPLPLKRQEGTMTQGALTDFYMNRHGYQPSGNIDYPLIKHPN